MSHLAANLKRMRERFPLVAGRLERARASRSGPPAFDEEEQRVLVDCWLADRDWASRGLYCLSGWGEVWLVAALLEAIPGDAWLLVVEPDPGVLKAALERANAEALLCDRRLLVAAGAPDEAFFACLDALDILDVMAVEPVVFAPWYERAPEDFATCFTEFARQVDTRRKLWGTATVDAALWQRNTLSNLFDLAAVPDVRVLQGAFAGRPMVLVSAGPSLDESLEFIRAASRLAVVVAVNSSYRAIRRGGVAPHVVLAADPRDFVAMCFRGVPVDGSWLVTTPIVNPEVVGYFPGRCLTWSGSNELFTEIRRRAGFSRGSRLIERGTVSACAVDLALMLGCDRVCLVGQDLALRTDGQTHATDSFYSDLEMNHADLGRCRMLPGNTLERVPVEEKLYVYLKTFEQLVAQRPHLRFCNTARLGARIAGAPYLSFEEALNWLGEEALPDPLAIIEKRVDAAQNETLPASRVLSAIGGIRRFAARALSSALSAAVGIESVPERCSPEEFSDAPPVRAAFARIAAMREVLASSPPDAAILYDGRTRLELYRSRQEERKIQAGAEHWRGLMRERETAWAIAEGAYFLLNGLDEAAAVDDRSVIGG